MKKSILCLLMLGLLISPIYGEEISVLDRVRTSFDILRSITYDNVSNCYWALSYENRLLYQFNENWNHQQSVSTDAFTANHLKGVTYDGNEDVLWFADFVSSSTVRIFKVNKSFQLLKTKDVILPKGASGDSLALTYFPANDSLWVGVNTQLSPHSSYLNATLYQTTKQGDILSSFTIPCDYEWGSPELRGVCYNQNSNTLWIICEGGKLFEYSINCEFERYINMGYYGFKGLAYNQTRNTYYTYWGVDLGEFSIIDDHVELIDSGLGFFHNNSPQAIEYDSENANFWSFTTRGTPGVKEVTPTGDFLRDFRAPPEWSFYGDNNAITVDSKRDSIWLSTAYVTIFWIIPPIYVYNTNLYEYTKDGVVKQKVEYSRYPFLRNTTIRGLTYDERTGHIWAVDEYTTSVLEINTSGTIVCEFSTADFGATKPVGIAYDRMGDNLWIVDADTDMLYHVWKDGRLIRSASIAHITTEPLDVCYERPGVLWLLDSQFAYRCDVSLATAVSTPWDLYY